MNELWRGESEGTAAEVKEPETNLISILTPRSVRCEFTGFRHYATSLGTVETDDGAPSARSPGQP